MARIDSGKPSRVRYTVEISGKTDEALERIALRRDTSKAELIRKAALLLLEWDRLENDGFSVGGWKESESGVSERERLLPMT